MSRPIEGTWSKRVRRFLDHDDRLRMEIGERAPAWIESFRKDLNRWGFNNVELCIDNPVLVKGRVHVYLEKK